MTVRVKYNCDACGKDLTFTSAAREYRLVLTDQLMIRLLGEGKPGNAKSPTFPEPLHFCRVDCLKGWAARSSDADGPAEAPEDKPATIEPSTAMTGDSPSSGDGKGDDDGQRLRKRKNRPPSRNAERA